jgi:hypothetical protein
MEVDTEAFAKLSDFEFFISIYENPLSKKVCRSFSHDKCKPRL